MTRVLIYFLLAALFLVLQVTLFPSLFSGYFKPELLLILVVYLSLHESFAIGSGLAYALGLLQDVFAGSALGLYGLAFLATFMAGRSLAARVNTESTLLLLLMVAAGSLLQGLVLVFALGILADSGIAWLVVLRQLPQQLLINLLAGAAVLLLTLRLQRRFAPRCNIPGLQHLDHRRER
jgi:rod shape-determining protein MreD